MALYVPRLSEHLARGGRYRCNEMFRMQTVAENVARMVFDRTSVTLKLPAARMPNAESHRAVKSFGTVQAGRNLRISLRVKCLRSDYLRSSHRIGLPFCAI